MADEHAEEPTPSPALASAAEETAPEPEVAAEAQATAPEPAPPALEEPPPATAPEPTAAEPAPAASEIKKNWYVVKVQSGREESIKEAIEKRIKIEGLEECYGGIIIPVEKVTEMKKGKSGATTRVVKEKKLFPGYIMVQVEYNHNILYLFRETSGVGDFVGGSLTRDPTPMSTDEVARMKRQPGEPIATKPGKPKMDRGDRVKIKEGPFINMEGEVKEINETKATVRVELTIFGRNVPVELEYWQVEKV